ncbi:MAG: cupin domain-containing protein [Bacteroidota bacterium]
MSADAPVLTYWHVWTDQDGVSRQSQATLEAYEKSSISEGAAPQFNNWLMQSAAQILFTMHPVGWVGEWHENPEPQWIVPLRGRWFVETMDGQRVEMGPGEVSFGADQNTVANEHGHRGHRSGTVGDEPCYLMVVQLKDDAFKAALPGSFEDE